MATVDLSALDSCRYTNGDLRQILVDLCNLVGTLGITDLGTIGVNDIGPNSMIYQLQYDIPTNSLEIEAAPEHTVINSVTVQSDFPGTNITPAATDVRGTNVPILVNNPSAGRSMQYLLMVEGRFQAVTYNGGSWNMNLYSNGGATLENTRLTNLFGTGQQRNDKQDDWLLLTTFIGTLAPSASFSDNYELGIFTNIASAPGSLIEQFQLKLSFMGWTV